MRTPVLVISLIVLLVAGSPSLAAEDGKLTADYVCVPPGYEAFDPDDMLAAYNVFRARYIPPAPGSVSINKAHVVGRCVFILWTWYKNSPAFQGPAVQYFYLLTRDPDRPCFFTLSDIGAALSNKESGKPQTVGTIDFSKLTTDYAPVPNWENVLSIKGAEKAVCDGPAAQNLGMGMNRPGYCFSGYVGLTALVGHRKFFDSLAHIYTKMCNPLIVKPDLR
jgi:hypothetical protein